jgi:hypothetical protein
VKLFLDEFENDPVVILQARFPNSFGVMPDEDARELRQIINEEFSREVRGRIPEIQG